MNWIKIEDMEDDPYEGWCWVMLKGQPKRIKAYRALRYQYMISEQGKGRYMEDRVSCVMKWPLPEPPGAGNEVIAHQIDDNKYQVVIIKGATPDEDITLRVNEDPEYNASKPDYEYTPWGKK